jgi:hypothetical protein
MHFGEAVLNAFFQLVSDWSPSLHSDYTTLFRVDVASRQPVFDGRPNRSATPNIAHNRSVMPPATRPSQTVPQRGLNGRTDHIAERHDSNWHHDWDRRHAHFDHGHFFVFINGFWCGLDDGFFPWDYLPYYPNDYYP